MSNILSINFSRCLSAEQLGILSYNDVSFSQGCTDFILVKININVSVNDKKFWKRTTTD